MGFLSISFTWQRESHSHRRRGSRFFYRNQYCGEAFGLRSGDSGKNQQAPSESPCVRGWQVQRDQCTVCTVRTGQILPQRSKETSFRL